MTNQIQARLFVSEEMQFISHDPYYSYILGLKQSFKAHECTSALLLLPPLAFQPQLI